ncbi:MAG: hypothetical protein MZV64_73430 [Ignavibacteriales bacterium]|nr:hypothetical protein [Ignavibacteriales bacterium]
MGAGVRAQHRRPGTVLRGVSRRLGTVPARGQRHPHRLHGDEEPVVPPVLRRHGHGRVDRRVAGRLSTSAGRAARRSCASSSRASRSTACRPGSQRYGMAAVVVPAMLPPPVPLKLFVLGAGVAGMPAGRFAWAIGIGRGVRYLAEGILAYYYGAAAFEHIRRHGSAVALWGAVLSAAVLVAYYWRRQRRRTAAV